MIAPSARIFRYPGAVQKIRFWIAHTRTSPSCANVVSERPLPVETVAKKPLDSLTQVSSLTPARRFS